MAIKNFRKQSIASYLQENIYQIPEYQREYSWEESQLSDFWEDLLKIKDEDRHHFFGQIVLNENNDGNVYIIDGQQRTTTAVILLSVFRDIFTTFESDSSDAQNNKEDIRIKYIGRWSPKKDELRLHLGKADRDFFRENIQKGLKKESEKTTKLSPSQKNIIFAYDYFYNKLNEVIKENVITVDDKVDVLTKYYETFLQKFDLIVVSTDEVNEAFIIFETLNARGKELETADLLKNYVFMEAGKNLDSVKDNWTKMQENLVKKDDATKFIRCIWNTSHRFTRERDLYREISKEITGEKCERFVKTLVNLVDCYNALIKPDDYKYFEDSDIADILCNLDAMNASTFYPIVFASYLKKFSDAEIKSILRAIETLVFRNFVVAKNNPNRYEIIFASIARDIIEEKKDVKGVLSEITKETVKDDDLRQRLIGFSIRSARLAKYILREIEDFKSPEKIVIKDSKKINLEHIMPVTKGKWDIQEDIHQEYVYRLANQTLLLEGENKAIKNKLFNIKKERYSQSKIEMTRELADCEVWGTDEIERREKNLIDIILKRWSLN